MVLQIGKYAVTISPPPNYSCHTDRQKLLHHFIEIKKRFKKFSKQYLIYPEFDKKFRLHYHGVVRVYDIPEFYKFIRWCKKNIGFVDVDSKDVGLRWTVYMSKEWGTTKQILKISDPITHFTRLSYNDSGRCDLILNNA